MSNWDNMLQWETVLPPSRPTEEELNRIIRNINSYDKNMPVAVLGSTPEFRDVLHYLNFSNIYIFDKSIDFYHQMSELLPRNVPENERFISGNWLETLPLYPQKFQFVLSDLTMGNLAYEQRKNFYESIYSSLMFGGIFIDKVLAFDFQVPTLDDLFRKYEILPINLRTINDFSSEVLFCSELVIKNQIVDSSKFYEIIRKGKYTEKIKLFAEKAKMITPEGFIWYYGKPWDELTSEYFSKYSSAIIYPEEKIESPYYNRTKQIFCYKK